ncbi:hypothetical protein BTUL_0009g00430 [Botrytis tulipae]|uniref:Uncharacterized protein n=1 Tax=Botrytis tulipae TaxID=87230 RepID=A0A4Z1F2B2_9HELO|nr:hypothetical protein BTUL_0009g00430 [Botrytis tulipae]
MKIPANLVPHPQSSHMLTQATPRYLHYIFLPIQLSRNRNNSSRGLGNTSNRAPRVPIISITLPLGSHLLETVCHGDGIFRSNNRNAHVTLYTTCYASAAVGDDVVYLSGRSMGVIPETGVVVVSADTATVGTICDGEAGEESGDLLKDVES